MKDHIKRTKIIVTLGPSVTGKIFSMDAYNDPKNKDVVAQAKKNIEDLINAGANVFRFNFSHGNHEEQKIRVDLIRQVEAKMNTKVSLLLDTKGPEIRVGKMQDGGAEIKKGDEVTILTNDRENIGNSKKFSVYPSSPEYFMEVDVKVGDPIYLDDGKLEIIAKKIDNSKHEIIGEAVSSHKLTSNKRINLPNADYSMPFMTEKEHKDIKFAVENGFDYIAASFVNTVENVREIKDVLKKHNAEHIQIISKIETKLSIKNIDDIISVSDAIMVARGDLGLEIPYYEVPFWEKYMIKACRFQGKPVIVATQMLDSLETKKQPTRAEVTDVFFAVERGADATMLSGESANGIDPVNAVTVMSNIDLKSEELFDYQRAREVYFQETIFSKKSFGKTVEKISKQVEPKRTIGNSEFPYDAIFYFGNDIEKIKALSNIRPAASIIVISDKKRLQTFFGLNYGVLVHYVDDLLKVLPNYKDKINELHDIYNLKRSNIVLIDDSYKELDR